MSGLPAQGFRRAALAAALLWLGACGEPADLTVGGKNFSEQDILGHILADWIEATTDLTVDRTLHLGGTFVCHRSLVAGEIDLYVEYTGTALTAILERAPVQDPDSVLRAVREEYRRRWDLAWSEPLGFENTFALLVRRETADSLGLTTFSGAVPHAGDWTAGFGYEFTEREDGLPGLAEAYGVSFDRIRTMDLGLLYRALDEGQVDLIAGNSTDGRIDALGLAVLRDDRDFFPPYDAAPVVRRELLERHPELRATLDRLGGRLSTGEMRRLNRLVALEGRSARAVARAWVEAELEGDGARRVGEGADPTGGPIGLPLDVQPEAGGRDPTATIERGRQARGEWRRAGTARAVWRISRRVADGVTSPRRRTVRPVLPPPAGRSPVLAP